MSNGGNTVPRIANAEHIGPNDTGDNIEAKRIANYGYDATNSQWRRLATNASGQQMVDVVSSRGSTAATTTTVADTATSTTLLATNADRRGATISNDSSAVLYALLGSGTASATNYTIRIAQYGYYEVPFGYTGQINGVWATDPGDGAARITELE